MLSQFFTVLLFLVQLGLDGAEECKLPKYEDVAINWNMITGKWYNTLNTIHDPLETVVKCLAICTFRQSGNDVFATIEDIRGVGKKPVTHGNIAIHWIKKKNPIYAHDTKFANLWLDEMSQGFNSKNPKMKVSLHEAQQEVQEFYTTDLSFYTDYENYIMGLGCMPSGEKSVWAVGPSPYPKAEDIIRMHNKLVEIGEGWESVPFIPAGCSDLEFQTVVKP